MQKVYINSIASISSQKTFDNTAFLEEIILYKDNVLFASAPNYGDFIAPAAARRMSKGIKMGIAASKLALSEAGLRNVDAIVIGTGMGCIRDSEKFVEAIIDNQEQYLTPTAFIQSTHNTVSGQVAIELQCKGYNITYVHSSVSFESAILDAKLLIELNESASILIGGVDELGDHTTEVHKLIGHVKKEKIDISEVLTSKTKGSIFGEGANFFVLSNEKEQSTYAQLKAIKLFNTMKLSDLSEELENFLLESGFTISDIDLAVLGNNGDVDFDVFYKHLSLGVLSETEQVFYKHLSGEFHTASSFGFWLASKIIKTQSIPKFLKNNNKSLHYKVVLLYNQYRGENHSFTLLCQY